MGTSATEGLLYDPNSTVVRSGIHASQSPAEVRVGSTGFVRASQTVTLSGTPDAGDTVTVVVRGISHTVTLTSAETTLTLAAALLAASINANPELNRYVTASAAVAVVTLTANAAGTLANNWTLTTVGVGITSTAGAATFASGTGNIATPMENFFIVVNGITHSFRRGRPVVLTSAIETALAGANLPIA